MERVEQKIHQIEELLSDVRDLIQQSYPKPTKYLHVCSNIEVDFEQFSITLKAPTNLSH